MKIDWKKEISIPKPSLPKRKPKDPAVKASAKAAEPTGAKEPTATEGLTATSEKRSRVSRPKLPSMSRPSGPNVNLPKPLSDLYGDLRDRHLLPLVLVLIAALIVVPIAFAGGGEDSAPPASQATIQTGQTATSSFTVIPAESRLTSPKRLAHRRPLDPFRQSPSGGSAGVEGSGGKEQGGSTGGESAPTETGSSGSAEEIAPLPESGGGETPAEVTKTTESTTTESTETVVAPQTIAYAIDLKTGFDPKNLQEQSEVAAMTKLPNKKNPALLYVGLSPDKKKALFLMTSRVTAYYGAAQCSLDKQACELIELTPGKSASFAIGYGEEPAIYKVLLKGIEPVVESLGSHSKTTKTKTKTHGKPKSRNSKSQAQSAVVGLGHAVVGH